MKAQEKENKIKILRAKRELTQQGGGAEKIRKQHEAGKMTARERLQALYDHGSFIENQTFVQHHCTQFGMEKQIIPSDGVVVGSGMMDGRLVYAFSQDFTCMGGSVGEMHAKKIVSVMKDAVKCGAPVVGINDSGGARIQEGVGSLSGYGSIFYYNTFLSGVVPQISIIAGPCAGGAVYSPAMTDFIIMVRGTAQMFIAGPNVIKAATGEDISGESLGGADTHARVSGNIHFVADTDQEALDIARRLLGFLPSNNVSNPPTFPTDNLPLEGNPAIMKIVPSEPRVPYDMKDIIENLVDNRDFMEIQKDYAPNLIIGFARFAGMSVGIVANQPKHLAGVLDIDSSDKGARFIRFCNTFNIPLVTLVDVPGFLPGVNQEYGGIIRHGAKMLFSYASATVPKLTVIIRKAYGGAYLAMCSKDMGADRVYAWPTAEIAVMGAEGAAEIVFKKEIAASTNPKEALKEKIEEYRHEFANPYIAAAQGHVDEVIEPVATRQHLIQALFALRNKRDTRPPKKHGNIPL